MKVPYDWEKMKLVTGKEKDLMARKVERTS